MLVGCFFTNRLNRRWWWLCSSGWISEFIRAALHCSVYRCTLLQQNLTALHLLFHNRQILPASYFYSSATYDAGSRVFADDDAMVRARVVLKYSHSNPKSRITLAFDRRSVGNVSLTRVIHESRSILLNCAMDCKMRRMYSPSPEYASSLRTEVKYLFLSHVCWFYRSRKSSHLWCVCVAALEWSYQNQCLLCIWSAAAWLRRTGRKWLKI